jgi:hypothetical protein
MKKWLLEFWRAEGVDRKTGIREQGSGIRDQGSEKQWSAKAKTCPRG